MFAVPGADDLDEDLDEDPSDYVSGSGKNKIHKSAKDSKDTIAVAALSNEDDKADANLLRRAKQRLRYLNDAYTIAESTGTLLKKNEYDEAVTMVRLASKKDSVVVSWNLLIGHLMRQDKLAAAIKLYNEMKKRAQMPNAQTYTIIFSGCAHSRHADQAVHHATRLYHSMMTNERFPPNKIHMNAVLNVCSRARDIDSMFSIAATANKKERAPDCVTYGTILNGLRYVTAQPHHRPNEPGNAGGGSSGNRNGEDEDGVNDVYIDKEQARTSVARARAVWSEVVSNWHGGVMMVDEKLVACMGRVLLLGDHNDNDDILSLVEQTVGLERLDRTPPGQIAAPKKDAKDEEVNDEKDAKAETATGDKPTITAVQTSPPRETQFDRRDKRAGLVKPGNNILSVVMSSLGTTKKTTLAMPYWEALTGPKYGVVPDSENYYRLLKTLRRGRASKKTVEILEKMPRPFLVPKTFQLAMATCAADNLNDHVFESAGKVLDLMVRTLNDPDPYTMRLYLQTTMTNNRRFRKETDPSKREAAKYAFGRQIVRALSRLWDPFRRAGNVLSYPAKPFRSPEEQHKETYNERRELMALARQMVSAADMVVTERMVTDEAVIRDLSGSRNLLNRQITRFYEKREVFEPKLKKAKRGPRNEKGRRWDAGDNKPKPKENQKPKGDNNGTVDAAWQ
ncbi:hypothetical protein Sste5344_007842 [Sporothrix stenoceras]